MGDQLKRLTVNQLAERLVGIIRSGMGESVVCVRHNGKEFDVLKLSISEKPDILSMVSVSDTERYDLAPAKDDEANGG